MRPDLVILDARLFSQPQLWFRSHRADKRALPLADRHYNRQKVGSPQFMPPGSCCCFLTERADALWGTAAPIAKYVKHAWPGAWTCSIFRSESPHRASDLIRLAVAATRAHYGDPPALGMVTFIDTSVVRPVKVRGVPTWGISWWYAGFEHVGYTQAGLQAWQLVPSNFPKTYSPLTSPPASCTE